MREKRPFDVGLARGPWGRRYFFERAGGGLLADYLRNAKRKAKNTKKLSKEQEMRRPVSLLRRMLHDYPARRWKIDIDGEEISDEYILWEAMNIRSVGPVLYLASQAGDQRWPVRFRLRAGKGPFPLHEVSWCAAGWPES